MTQQPLVSVIMPVFNSEKFLAQAIESILAQTYQSIEFFIVDDKSTDNSREIIKSYAKRFPTVIHAIFLKKNHGESYSANAAYKKTRGIFIARMDADDISFPTRIEEQIYFLLKHPEISVVGTQGYTINETDQVIGEKLFPLTHVEIYRQFGILNAILHPTCVFRKSIFSHKLYQDVFEECNDYLTFFTLLRRFQFANLPFRLHYYRIHRGNTSLKHPKRKFFASIRIRWYAKKNLDYRYHFFTYLNIAAQCLLILLLPEKLIVPLYMLFRGMYQPTLLLKKLFFPVFFAPSQL